MVRVPWNRGTSEEDARVLLQERLTLLFKLLFWCFVALMAFIWGMYRLYPDEKPQYNDLVYASFGLGISIQAFIWRGVLLRRKLSLAQLEALDMMFLIGANALIAGCAIWSFDQRQSAYTCFIYTCWTVLTRALIVPSTGKRTAILTAIAMIPMGIAGTVLSEIATWPREMDVPAGGLLVGYVQITTVAVLLASFGSRIIYGLRQRISAAQQLGQYTLGRKLGEGGMGAVYLAHHVLLRRPTAVKLLPPSKVGHDNLQRFEREVQHMSQLTHPNTVAVFTYGHSPDGVFYYAMEYLGGGVDLELLVARHGKQPAERVRQIMIQVCGALHEAHERGIIHRDIKPANIILCERGAMPDFVKVVDFGLVKEIESESGQTTQVILGTPSYIAPEAITDPNTIGPASDLYALGCVAYFLLTGKRVFEGSTPIDVCMQHVTKPPTPPYELGVAVPHGLEVIVMRCLAKAPGDRHPNAQVLADALRDLGPLADWDEARASTWWIANRRSEDADSANDTPTMTIPIDVRIGERL